MKKIYCTAEYPTILMTESRQRIVTEELFREELQRLIDQAVEDGENPVNQALDQLRMADYPAGPRGLVQSMMQEDPVYNLFRLVDGMELVEAPQEIQKEYERWTLMNFLIEVMPDQNH